MASDGKLPSRIHVKQISWSVIKASPWHKLQTEIALGNSSLLSTDTADDTGIDASTEQHVHKEHYNDGNSRIWLQYVRALKL